MRIFFMFITPSKVPLHIPNGLSFELCKGTDSDVCKPVEILTGHLRPPANI